MSVCRLWHWPNIEPTMGECPCLPGYAKLPVLGGWQWSLINCNALKTIGQIVSNCATFHIVAACLVAGCEAFIGIINCQSVCLSDWLISWLTIALSSSSQLSTLNAAVFNRHREGNLRACFLKLQSECCMCHSNKCSLSATNEWHIRHSDCTHFSGTCDTDIHGKQNFMIYKQSVKYNIHSRFECKFILFTHI